MSKREPRFPGIDWWCDECNSYLNEQKGFDDHKYVWKCKVCGYKNSISQDDIDYGLPKVMDFFGILLGWTRSLIVYAILIYVVGLYLYEEPTILSYYIEYIVISYLAVQVLSMIFEKGIAKYCAGMPLLKYVFTTPFVYVLGDIFRPFDADFVMVKAVALYYCKRQKAYITKKVIIGLIYLPFTICTILLIRSIILHLVK